jgi:nitrogen fixation/metabolism regulation signal transduction histidine kinase
MLSKLHLAPSLNMRLIIMMLFLSFILITILLFIYSHSERSIFREIERQTSDLTKAIQIGVEEVTATGSTDEARLSKYLKQLNAKGLNEISIISNSNEIVASTNPSKVGQPLAHKRKELIIKAELGEPVSEEGRAYNVILPVIAGNTQYGYIHLKINKDDFSDILRANTIKRIVAIVFVFGLGIVITFILSKQYTRPIQKVVDAARRVAAGDLNQNISVQSRDEIGQLSESFNFMVEKLRETRTLEQRLREAEHLSGLGQLSRDIAHEIRNPLNFINLSIDHIGEKYKPAEAERTEKFGNLISGMKQEIQRLNNLVNEFLDYSRPIKLNLRRARIDALLEDVMALIWAKAEADGIVIVREYAHTAELDVDPDLFKSCVLNVITNAFHAMASSEREKVLTLKTETAGEEFVISLIDTGTGVSRENLSKIFEPFFSTRQSGLGLGLPMTKRVMEEHGGRVEFSSVEAEGSEVRLIFPLQRVSSYTKSSAYQAGG